MTDSEHIEILRRGPKFWNAWREQYPSEVPNLNEAALSPSERQMGSVNGGPVNLRAARMQNASLRYATLSGAELEFADLSGADLAYARLNSANLKAANLSHAVLDHADFADANLTDANLSGTSLRHAQNLIQRQIEHSITDADTILPPHLNRPGIRSEVARNADVIEIPSRGNIQNASVSELLGSTNITKNISESTVSETRGPALQSIRRHLAITAVLALGLLGGLGGWAATTELAGAVIAPGVLVVESNVKKVQHPIGGVVVALNVKNGDFVHAGDVLARLDDTQTRANLGIIMTQLDEFAARKARLEAEKNGDASPIFPEELLARVGDADASTLISGERRLFELRRDGREGQKSQLRERAHQLEEQIEGLKEQLDAKNREIALIYDELKGVKELWQKNLVPITRVTSLERDAARLEGERGQVVASTAETRAKIAEIDLQIIQIDQDLRSEVGKELADIRAKLAELGERKIAAEDQLKRVDLRAPQDGLVHQITVHTVGGVISAGETIMLIVPNADALMVEARVAPKDIDELHLAQAAVLRFSAFNLRTTPELNGKVAEIAADFTQDQRTGQSYYTVRIAIPPSELKRLGDLKLLAGMPVDAFVQTGGRTALTYLTKPLFDQVARAFRES